MGEYRRFVSYLYEYRNEKKEKIAGAVRVDCRGVRTQNHSQRLLWNSVSQQHRLSGALAFAHIDPDLRPYAAAVYPHDSGDGADRALIRL